MRLYFSFFLGLFILTGCVNQSQQPLNLLEPVTNGARVKNMHGIVMTIKGCEISPERTATCHFTALSKHQDRSLNLIGGQYTRMQDDTGVSYNTHIAFGQDPADRSQRAATLIADTPYDFTMRSYNLSTQATSVRAIAISRMDVKGPNGIAYLKLNFAHPPMIDSTGQTDALPKPMPAKDVPVQTDMPYRYLFATIQPINDTIPVDPTIKAMWHKGAYLYLNPKGSLGHNWSKPGSYLYAPGQSWHMENGQLTIRFEPQVSYTFDLSNSSSPMVASLDQGGVFKMTAYPKKQGQK